MLAADVLTRTNTDEYTPTEDFHPATKKYVDDEALSGPASAIDENIPVFDGTTGKVIKDGFGVQDTLSSSATALVRADAIVTALLNKTDKLAQVVTTASGFTVDIDDADTVFVLTNTSAITVSLPDDTGAVQETSTFVFQNPGFFYEIDGTTGQNPTITLVRGQTYAFNFEAVTSSHPIALRLAADNTSVVPGTTGNDPVNGVSGSGAIVTYVVPNDAPNNIVYQCVIHGSMLGTINIVDAVVGTTIPIGTQVAFIRNGIGTVTFAGSGTILSDSGKKDIKSQYSSAAVIKIAADT